MKFPRKTPSGFTLIELLTVIAIIGILAAILIPTVGKVRASAQAAKTVVNLRTLLQANRLHAADWRGMFVPPVATDLAGNGTTPAQWYNNPNFVRYVQTVNTNGWGADTVMNSGKSGAWAGGGPTLALSFGGNGGTPRNVSFRDADVDKKFPRMVMFGDAANWLIWGTRARDTSDDVYTDQEGVSSTTFGNVAYRHEGKGHFVLASGAVVKLSKADLADSTLYGQWFPDRGGAQANIKAYPAPY